MQVYLRDKFNRLSQKARITSKHTVNHRCCLFVIPERCVSVIPQMEHGNPASCLVVSCVNSKEFNGLCSHRLSGGTLSRNHAKSSRSASDLFNGLLQPWFLPARRATCTCAGSPYPACARSSGTGAEHGPSDNTSRPPAKAKINPHSSGR